MKSSSYSNSISYVIFTVVPIVLFTIVLILKLRGNYDIHVKHIMESLNECRISRKAQNNIINTTTTKEKQLRSYNVKCENMLKRSNDSWDRLTLIISKHDPFNQTQISESQIITSVQELKDNLNNVTNERDFLRKELERLSNEVSSLKSNTSKLQGEKESLERVLEVKTVLEESHRIKEAASVLETNQMVETKNVIREMVNDTIHELVESSNETMEREKIKKDSIRIKKERDLIKKKREKGFKNPPKYTSKIVQAESTTSISLFHT
ncbi:uncharacterized protein [Lepeophtheirus salmonis]|uniref:uncharacterized protein n=1 Tax=Lepeophtheirus salmonis TaxID=72036 RepID=UPI001AE9E90B|nr:uncharacterized protein LOC121122761 [Lepeophtheirus salmonis]XP_040573735.1 uncharacterized protein LOC121122761 [Lepeophtheirus salmonis]